MARDKEDFQEGMSPLRAILNNLRNHGTANLKEGYISPPPMNQNVVGSAVSGFTPMSQDQINSTAAQTIGGIPHTNHSGGGAQQQTAPGGADSRGVISSGMHDIGEYLSESLRNYSSGIRQQREAQMQQLGGIESSLFDQMGRMQLQTERDIANRRMQALRSGMPSSQLAVMELQNVQTAQLGAQEMAKEYDMLRMQMGTELAGAEDLYAATLQEQFAQSRTDMAAIEAQRYASDWGAQIRDWAGADTFDNMDFSQRLATFKDMTGLELTRDQEKSIINLMGENPDQPAIERWVEENWGQAIGGFLGASGGAIGGLKLGAVVGSAAGPIGTVVGGIAGLLIGMYGGSKVQSAVTRP